MYSSDISYIIDIIIPKLNPGNKEFLSSSSKLFSIKKNIGFLSVPEQRNGADSVVNFENQESILAENL